mgnify:CR=1 FL=1
MSPGWYGLAFVHTSSNEETRMSTATRPIPPAAGQDAAAPATLVQPYLFLTDRFGLGWMVSVVAG